MRVDGWVWIVVSSVGVGGTVVFSVRRFPWCFWIMFWFVAAVGTFALSWWALATAAAEQEGFVTGMAGVVFACAGCVFAGIGGLCFVFRPRESLDKTQ